MQDINDALLPLQQTRRGLKMAKPHYFIILTPLTEYCTHYENQVIYLRIVAVQFRTHIWISNFSPWKDALVQV